MSLRIAITLVWSLGAVHHDSANTGQGFYRAVPVGKRDANRANPTNSVTLLFGSSFDDGGHSVRRRIRCSFDLFHMSCSYLPDEESLLRHPGLGQDLPLTQGPGTDFRPFEHSIYTRRLGVSELQFMRLNVQLSAILCFFSVVQFDIPRQCVRRPTESFACDPILYTSFGHSHTERPLISLLSKHYVPLVPPATTMYAAKEAVSLCQFRPTPSSRAVCAHGLVSSDMSFAPSYIVLISSWKQSGSRRCSSIKSHAVLRTSSGRCMRQCGFRSECTWISRYLRLFGQYGSCP
ncbi:hypothetical protein IW261DRAFT_820669 [Armillaria novae-zelandiae]|uniref:Secreted protein n=1 Tax=Armillaria novae-zelandiae TaxID=153914 RepID=A0AA39TWG1_9AGAR|nr:hypothetical protein IW261DRAFT_820669 [Armillaria novae-zelandiae]